MKLLGLKTVGLLFLQLGALGCGDSTSTTAEDAGMMYEPGPTCTAFCAKAVGECEAFEFTEESCEQGCEQNLEEERSVSEVCGDAVETVFQCVAALDCSSVAGWVLKVPVDSYPCSSEVAEVDRVCLQV